KKSIERLKDTNLEVILSENHNQNIDTMFLFINYAQKKRFFCRYLGLGYTIYTENDLKQILDFLKIRNPLWNPEIKLDINIREIENDLNKKLKKPFYYKINQGSILIPSQTALNFYLDYLYYRSLEIPQ
ncbi:MAG: hypothetical protein QW757_02155, partial [Candidatus Woesearchaeota archaeon]